LEKATKIPRVAKVGKGGMVPKAVRVAKAKLPKEDGNPKVAAKINGIGKMELMTLKLPATAKENGIAEAAKVTKVTTRTARRMERMALKRTAKLIGDGKVRNARRMEAMALKTVLLKMDGGGIAKAVRAKREHTVLQRAAADGTVKADGLARA